MGRNAHGSDRCTGERMVANEVRWLGTKMDELLSAYDAAKVGLQMLSFADVERI